MNPLLRTLRGVMGIGLTWAAMWAAVFSVLILVVGVFRPGDIDAGEGPIEVAAIMGFVGLVSGVAFGVLLSLAENAKAILDLSRGRVALWGALASAAYPLATGRQDQTLLLCPLGSVVALALVGIARKATRREPVGAKRRRDVLSGAVLGLVRDVVRSPGEAHA